MSNMDFTVDFYVISHWLENVIYRVQSIDTVTLSVCAGAFVAVIYITTSIKLKFSKRWRVKASKRLMRKLLNNRDSFTAPKLLVYLKKIDPYLFEELLLTAFEARGLKVIRSKRYSGDGGVDGRFVMDEKLYLIQAKRYKNHIKKEHMIEFSNIVEKDKKASGGVFIHTGRTGKETRQSAFKGGILIISGDNLYRLIMGLPLTMDGKLI
ncbi:MAG: restriction endonuclease [Methylococcales bacterium]